MGAQIGIVGTRVAGAATYAQLLEDGLREPGSALRIAAAYWDATALGYVRDASARAGSVARVVLWTEGGSKGAWRKSAFVRDDPHLDVRFVDSPDEEGIFHVKLGGIARQEGSWACAVVGSCNLTARALSRNLELGVVIRQDEAALATLREWFDAQFEGARTARDIEWDEAIERAPESIAKLHGRGEGAQRAPLAPRAPATGAVPPPREPASKDHLARILADATGRAPKVDKNGVHVIFGEHDEQVVQRVTLEARAEGLAVRLWPGESKQQALRLYAGDRADALLRAARDGRWRVSPGPNLAFHGADVRDRYYFATPAGDDVQAYVDGWRRHRDDIRGGKDGTFFPAMWDRLVDLGLAIDDEAKREAFRARLPNSSVILRPAIAMELVVPDDADAVHAVRRAVQDALAVLGEPPLPAAAPAP